jgi:F-type H+-transporting ATPase subunit epsilon
MDARSTMSDFHFELVSPDRLVFRGQVASVLAPGSEGDFVVLKDHAPVMASLRPGVVVFEDASGKQTRVFVRGGFADVSAAGMILLADTAIAEGELDAQRLDEEIADAEEDLADAPDEEKRLWQEKLDRLRELKDAMKL